jgi:hypothetical protein
MAREGAACPAQTFFPLCGKLAKHFSIVWKNPADFSTLWKHIFHTVENFSGAPLRKAPSRLPPNQVFGITRP